jgi:hypothetical protein
MQILLTSFGISHLSHTDNLSSDLFFRMPPACMASAATKFRPDYPVFLLCDKVILDRQTYDRLLDDRHWSYAEMAYTLKALEGEGFVQLEDFDSIVASNRELLDSMLVRDLKELDQWVPVLKESTSTWRDFIDNLDAPIRDEIRSIRDYQRCSDQPFDIRRLINHEFADFSMYSPPSRSILTSFLAEEAMNSSSKRRKTEFRDALRTELSMYLSYVNANLVLSNALECGFHDWQDFRPFYRDKFLRVGKDAPPAEQQIDAVNSLFNVSFPEFTFWRPKEIIRAIKDKRIRELRQLVDAAVNGEATFDREFAVRVLHEVFKVEQSMAKVRNLLSYVTLPIDFVPFVGNVAQKVAEEAIARPIESKKKKPFRWFYLISELAESSKNSQQTAVEG